MITGRFTFLNRKIGPNVSGPNTSPTQAGVVRLLVGGSSAHEMLTCRSLKVEILEFIFRYSRQVEISSD